MDKSSPENTEEFKQNQNKIRLKDNRLRPKSASKYISTFYDYNQTSESYKRHSNPSVIEKILKKSLKKVKIQKITQKKASKLKSLKSELRKSELEYQNKKIRLNNSLSMRNKRSRSKEKPQKNNENPGLITIKTDSSPQSRKKDLIFMSTSKKPKKVLISSKRKTKNISVLEFIKKKKSQRSKQEHQDKMKEKAKKFVKAQNLEKLEKFITKSFRKSRDNSLSSIESDPYAINPNRSETFNDVNRNISFIYEDGSEKSFTKDDELSMDKGKTFDNEIKFTDTIEDDRKSTDLIYKTRGNCEKVKSTEFSSVKFKFSSAFDIELQEGLEVMSKKPKVLETSSESDISILPVSKKPLRICNKSSLSINPSPKQIMISSTQTELFPTVCPQPSLSIQTKPQVQLKASNLPSISIKGLANSTSLDQYSWNLALLFLIDQLHLYEISDLTENFPSVTSKILKKIGKKYVQVKDFIQNSFDKISSELLESLSFEQHTKFIQLTHDKKIGIQKVLTEAFEASLESSESDQDANSGIPHSHSLQYLHEETLEKKEKSGEMIVSFGFEDVESKDGPCVVSISDASSSGFIMNGLELKNFVENVFNYLDWDFIMKEIAKPLFKDPLQELDKLQETQIGSPTETEILNFPWLFNLDNILQALDDNETLENFEKIHRKMIFHVLNYLLQQFRPFGYKGFPLPWSKIPVFYFNSNTLQDIKEKLISDFQILNSLNIGSVVEVDPWIKKPSEAELVKMKVLQLDKIIFFEAFIEEGKWVDYEFEIAQVNIDLADIVLQELALELIKCVDS